MRIALVVTGGVDRSGRERVLPVLLWLVERLARRHHVSVYALRHYDKPCSYPLLGASIHDLGRPSGVFRQYRSLLRALGRDGPFDTLHAFWALPCGLVAAAAARRLRVPSIVTLSSGELVSFPEIDYGLQRRQRQRLAVAATLRLATKLTVASGFMQRLARAHGAEALLIPNGVDTRFFVPATRPDGPPWRLLTVASLSLVKDQTTLLQGFCRLRDRIPDVHLDIVGEDTLGGMVQGVARSLNVDAHVTFHGFQPTDRLLPLYQRAHLFVLSSRHEASSVAMLEAAACGVATVGTNVGYVADWTPDLALGVPFGDPVALADAIAQLLEDSAQRERIAAAARKWTLAHDADWSAEQFERLYGDLIRARTGS